MPFDDRILRVYAKRMLRPRNGFAEQGTFFRRNLPGVPKTIRTSVQYRSQSDENDGTREKRTVIGVFMLKHEGFELDGIVYDGVKLLRKGDLYIRDPKFDCDERPFSFTGAILEEGQHYRVAEFQRYSLESVGHGGI